MKTEDKTNIQSSRLLGEFIGTLEGVCLWDIPEELKLKLQSKLTELRGAKIVSSTSDVMEELPSDEEIDNAIWEGVEKDYAYDRNKEEDIATDHFDRWQAREAIKRLLRRQ